MVDVEIAPPPPPMGSDKIELRLMLSNWHDRLSPFKVTQLVEMSGDGNRCAMQCSPMINESNDPTRSGPSYNIAFKSKRLRCPHMLLTRTVAAAPTEATFGVMEAAALPIVGESFLIRTFVFVIVDCVVLASRFMTPTPDIAESAVERNRQLNRRCCCWI